jgi:hypothetical protein
MLRTAGIRLNFLRISASSVGQSICMMRMAVRKSLPTASERGKRIGVATMGVAAQQAASA